MLIRKVKTEDAKEILSIYAPYVEKTAITFEYEVPSLEEFKERIRNIMEKYPYLVAEEDGEILGYAYASTLRTRKAFEWVVEPSIYLSEKNQGKGIGKKLYEELEKELREAGFKTMYACIASIETEDEYLTNDSVRFHEHMGFEHCGAFHGCGLKFNRWYDVTWMGKAL